MRCVVGVVTNSSECVEYWNMGIVVVSVQSASKAVCTATPDFIARIVLGVFVIHFRAICLYVFAQHIPLIINQIVVDSLCMFVKRV